MPEPDAAPRVDTVGELYHLRPGEFVGARDALARRLRDEGRKDEAAEVKKRRRPTVVAWAVNQLARIDPDGLDRLIAESERLRDAQHEAVSGSAAELRSASESRRKTVASLADRAAELLVESGVSDARHEQEIAATLDAASLDPDKSDDLRAGQLERELERSGFAFGAEWTPRPAGERSDRDARRAEAEARREREAAIERAERDLRRARDRVEGADEEIERLSRRLDRAKEERDDAAEAMREAEARLEELKR